MISVRAENKRAADWKASAWILMAGACVGLGSFLYYYAHGLTTAHYDAKAHLVVARRIVDSVTPGYQQMGAHWLPLIHIVYLPFVLIDSQYHSGILPSLISVCAFILSGWLAYRITARSAGSQEAGIFAAIVLLANTNLEYLQSCPLTEPLALMFLLLTMDALLKWRASAGESLPWLPAVWAALGALCRYEGWYFLGGILLLLAYDWWTGRLSARRAARAALIYVGIFAVPVVAHFGYIYATLGDSFFQRVARGNPAPYVTHKRPVLSFLYHLGELSQISAVIPLLTALAGVAFALSRRSRFRQFLPLFLLWLPSLANVSALYWGLIYRVRYSVLILPAVAVFAGLLVSKAARKRAFIAGCLVAMGLPLLSWCFPREWRFHAFFPGPGILILPVASLFLLLVAMAKGWYRWPLLALCVLAMQVPVLSGEARPILEETGEHAFIEPERQEVLKYLRMHYDGGRILIDMGRLAPLAYDSGLPLKEFIYNEGDNEPWRKALRTPEAEVGWLCAEKGDDVWDWLQVDPRKADRYSPAVQTENFLLYRLKPTTGAVLPFRRFS